MSLLCSASFPAPPPFPRLLRLLGPQRRATDKLPNHPPLATPVGGRSRRGVAAVLVSGFPPEQVMAEALAQAATAAGPLQLIILRRTAGFSTDAALVAAVERAAHQEYNALLAQLPGLLPAWALSDGQFDVVRAPGVANLTPARPSRALTTRVLRLAQKGGSSVVVTDNGVLQPLSPSLTGIRIVTVPVDGPPGGRTTGRAQPVRP